MVAGLLVADDACCAASACFSLIISSNRSFSKRINSSWYSDKVASFCLEGAGAGDVDDEKGQPQPMMARIAESRVL